MAFLPYSSRTVCVVDNGLFPEVAVTLAKSFGRTLYYSSWESPYPRANNFAIGDGLASEGVARVNSIWPHIDDIDLFVFPDILHGPLQVFLRSLGKRVWGSGLAESLEYKRADSKRWLQNLGLPVGPYRVLHGTTELRRHLQRHDNVFVKISMSRGDMETFHSENYELIEPRLDELEHGLGPNKDYTEFVVEEPIPTTAEVGYDGFTIDGQYPSYSLFGVETKDAGYIGHVVPYGSLPKSVSFVNSKLSPLFNDLKYRGFWSSEIRVDPDGTPYLIDPCCRMGSPPGELYLYLIENLADVIWNGAEGQMVEPRWRYRWGAELILKSQWAESGWQPIQVPEEFRENVKLHYLTRIGESLYYVPQQLPMPEIGAVVAGGDTPEEAIRNVETVAEYVKGYDVKYDVAALEKAVAAMDSMPQAA